MFELTAIFVSISLIAHLQAHRQRHPTRVVLDLYTSTTDLLMEYLFFSHALSSFHLSWNFSHLSFSTQLRRSPLAVDGPNNDTPISLVLNITASFSIQFHDFGSIFVLNINTTPVTRH
ncbi:hypothetical protein QL285_094174 [Trifolium repens]|nr:hypothetical protein QL285_094174 [Trifolium repens]